MKSIKNLFNEIIAQNFPVVGKEMHIKVQESLRMPTDMTRKQSLHSILYLKCQEHRTKKEYKKLEEKSIKLLTKAILSE
jgi:hypothetical protein